MNESTERYETITSELLQKLESIDVDTFNKVPFENSWTPAQLAQHLRLSDNGIIMLMNGPEKSTERDPEKLVEQIRTDFLDFSVKFTSPEIITPAQKSYDKEILLDKLRSGRKSIADVYAKRDTNATCLMFEFPVYGFLTRRELMEFVIVHTIRHIHQLDNMVLKMGEVVN